MRDALSIMFLLCLTVALLAGCDEGGSESADAQDDDTGESPADDDSTPPPDDDAGDDDVLDDDLADDDGGDDDLTDDDAVDDDSVDDDTVTPPEKQWFYDEQHRVIVFHGVQVIQETPPYVSWHTRDDYARLLEWGLNEVRLGIVWAAVEPERGVYDESFLAQLDERIAWCRELGISVILEVHQDLYGEKFGDGAPEWACLDNGLPYQAWEPWFLNYLQPAVIAAFNNFWRNTDGVQDAFIAMWTHLAARYADERAIVGYDLMNEPYFGTYLPFIRFDRRALTPFYQKLIASMQSVDPNHLYFVEPAGAVGTGIPCYLTDLGLPNVAYAPHFYPFMPNILDAYFGNAGKMAKVVDHLEWTARNMQAPVWVGEWALFDAGTINAELYLRDVTRLFDERALSWSYWIYNKDGNVGLLDPDGNERTWVLDEVSRPYPQQVCGYPTAFPFDSDTKRFELSWTENPEADGPTVIYVPQRHYPQGFTVACSDPAGDWSYEWDEAAQLLTVTVNRAIPSHTLTIEPTAR